ncbi:MAG: hypothetical protein O8C66_13520 [Candidatus Methanoperedens sp.]|nr:hypothetical protein [Candidatus Methanoperedens sp.]MCZ7371517.1 hypothetical protein [Candidatus Methanoperedens sp.]
MKIWHGILIFAAILWLIHLFAGISIILKGGSYEAAKSATSPLGIIITLLIYSAAISMIKDKGWFEQDERTLRLSGIAFRYSYICIMIIVAALVGIYILAPEKLSVDITLSVIGTAVLIIPFALLQYFDRKGDAK